MKTHAAVLRESIDATDLINASPVEIQTVDVDPPVETEVLVEIKAAGLCHTDVSIVRGHLEEQYPLIMGHEGAGIVRKVGEDVTSVQPGDHVALGRAACGTCDYCRQGQSYLCENRFPSQRNGTLRTGAIKFHVNDEVLHHCHSVSSFSEYTVVTEETAVPIHDEVPMDVASLLGCGVFTGVGAVTNTANIELGSSVAIFGVGGVGLCAVQGAALRSAQDIIAVDPQSEKLDLASELGATHTINPESEDPAGRIQHLTNGGVDYAFEITGLPKVLTQCVDVLSPTGTAVLVGIPPHGKQQIDLDIYDIVLSEKKIIGSLNGSYNLPIDITRLSELVAEGSLDLTPLITDKKPMSNINNALSELAEGDQIRQVLYPDR